MIKNYGQMKIIIPRNTNQEDKCNNLLDLIVLILINSLKLRYKQNNIYTLNDIFIAEINPYKNIDIYDIQF